MDLVEETSWAGRTEGGSRGITRVESNHAASFSRSRPRTDLSNSSPEFISESFNPQRTARGRRHTLYLQQAASRVRAVERPVRLPLSVDLRQSLGAESGPERSSCYR